jgi:hypothetical protein
MGGLPVLPVPPADLSLLRGLDSRGRPKQKDRDRIGAMRDAPLMDEAYRAEGFKLSFQTRLEVTTHKCDLASSLRRDGREMQIADGSRITVDGAQILLIVGPAANLRSGRASHMQQRELRPSTRLQS